MTTYQTSPQFPPPVLRANNGYYPIGYEDPHVAALLHPFYEGTPQATLWLCEAAQVVYDDGIATGFGETRPAQAAAMPPYADDDCLRFALACALSVYQEPSFVQWAAGWLHRRDRTEASALRMRDRLLSGFDYAGPAHGCLRAALDPPRRRFWSACAAWRAFVDSQRLLDLPLLAEAVRRTHEAQ